MSDLAEQIWALVEPYLAAEGVELDDVEILGGGKLLRVTVDADKPLELDHIAALSRGIGRLLEEADPVASSYTLEVSSPGLERKLRRPAQFEKAVGSEVAVKTRPAFSALSSLRAICSASSTTTRAALAAVSLTLGSEASFCAA